MVLALLPRARFYPEDEREGRLPAPDDVLGGDELLAAITEAMVGYHQRYHHRAPAAAKTMLLGGDLLACVLGGVYTDVEKTMIEIQRGTIVQETRNAFQNAMQDTFINAVQRLSGRHVRAFISNHHVGPDIEIELFSSRPPACLRMPSETPIASIEAGVTWGRELLSACGGRSLPAAALPAGCDRAICFVTEGIH